MIAFHHRLHRPRPAAWLRVLALVAGLFVAGSASAQAPDVDPPGRVARVGETFGQVWLYSPENGEWVGAERNRPLTTGDRIATDPGARAELSVGSTTLRLDSDTELEVLNLDDNQVALRLHDGAVAARIRDVRATGEFELTTEEGRMRVQSAGRYRFDRRERASHVTVYAGQAQFEGPGNGLTLYSGQRGEFWFEPNGAIQYSITDPMRDAFAGWIAERDRAEDRLVAAAPRYVSPEMTGAAELDRYGRWEQSPEYGPIWFPRGVVAGWAPYSTGHWAWVRPWGWTWVDDAPWGFAPFHYGRWVYFRNAWCWAPGTFVARPVYAPALVAWVGGPQLSVSISIGGGGPAVGWFPLGPREVYVPAYRASPRYVREVNVTHVTNVTNITNVINNPPRDYANRKYPHAVTVVPATVLTNREPVAPSAARMRDLPPVRAIVNQPAQLAASVTPPVAAPAPRGGEARPDRPGEGGRAVPGRPGRPNAGEGPRVAPGVGPGGPPSTERRGPPDRRDVGTPMPMPERRGPDRRDAGAPVPPSAQPAAVAPVAPTVPVRPATGPAVVPPRAAVAAQPVPQPVAPGQAAAPPHAAPPPRPAEGQMRTIPRNERELRREREVPVPAARPAESPRPAVAPPQAQAPAPRPAGPPVAPAARPAERPPHAAPQPAAPPPTAPREAQAPEHRRGPPEDPQGRGRPEPGERSR